MSKEAHRPSNTVKWEHKLPILLYIDKNDVIEYGKVNSVGQPLTRVKYANKQATVILGHKEIPLQYLMPEDNIWTCIFNANGVCSSIGGHAGEEVTVIIHNA